MSDFIRIIRDSRAPDLEAPEGWQAHAACADKWWLFDLDDIRDTDDVIEALSICAGCPVRIDCEKQRIEHAEHLQRNLVIAGRAWVKGKPWNPLRDKLPRIVEHEKPLRQCNNCGGPAAKITRGFCSRCYDRFLDHGDPNGGKPFVSPAERYDQWLELQELGYSKRNAAHHMGITKASLNKAISRAVNAEKETA